MAATSAAAGAAGAATPARRRGRVGLGAGVRTLAELVDPRANTLNFVRLLLAASVVVWHAYPLHGREFPWPWAAQLAGNAGVDGFFAISGFLLAGSWLHKPHLLTYAANRALRILPAFWVCLVVVAAGFAPLSLLIQGQDPAAVLSGPHSAFAYVLGNADLSIGIHDVAGTPAGVPFDGVWNGSLWTLRWEALAYVGLAVLGLLGVLRRRRLVLALLVGLWLVGVGLALGVVPDGYWVSNGARLGLMFVAGAAVQLYADRLPASRWAAAGAAALVLVSPVLVDYRVLGGPALAYLVIWLGGAVRSPRLRLADRDISYGLYIYAFPVQQTLVLLGTAALPPLVAALLALVATVPLAAASWVLVERPALRLKSRLPWSRRPARPGTPVAAAEAEPPAVAVAGGAGPRSEDAVGPRS